MNRSLNGTLLIQRRETSTVLKSIQLFLLIPHGQTALTNWGADLNVHYRQQYEIRGGEPSAGQADSTSVFDAAVAGPDQI